MVVQNGVPVTWTDIKVVHDTAVVLLVAAVAAVVDLETFAFLKVFNF
jgi:hypothetical protein